MLKEVRKFPGYMCDKFVLMQHQMEVIFRAKSLQIGKIQGRFEFFPWEYRTKHPPTPYNSPQIRRT